MICGFSVRPAALSVAVASGLLVGLPLMGGVVTANAAVPAASLPAVTEPTDTPTSSDTPTLTPPPLPVDPPPAPVAGAAGLGDRLFPKLGNGGYDVQSYNLSLKYATRKPSQSVTGTVTIVAEATESLSRFDLDYAGKSAGKVTVNGTAAKLHRTGQELVITPAMPIGSGTTFTIKVTGFVAKPTKPGKSFASTAFFITKEGSVLAGQPSVSHYFYPSNDHPSEKASYTIKINVPKGETAVANGVLKSRTSTKTRTTWTYAQREPMAPELTQVAVGKYSVITRPAASGVKIRDVVPTAQLKVYKEALAVEGAQVSWMTRQVGHYPFTKYGSLVVNAKLGFALETQTLSLYNSQVFLYQGKAAYSHRYWAPVTVHELSHQWFGDSVSPKTWSDVWLNEGHATWYEVHYTYTHGWLLLDYGQGSQASMMKYLYGLSDQLRAQNGPVAHPNTVNDVFGENVYYGGALALYALRQKIGSKVFQKVEKAWLSTYQGKSASTADFIALAGQVSGQDLSGFLNDWLYSTKTPPMPGHPAWKVTPVGHLAAGSVAGPSLLHLERR